MWYIQKTRTEIPDTTPTNASGGEAGRSPTSKGNAEAVDDRHNIVGHADRLVGTYVLYILQQTHAGGALMPPVL